jgi:hypothetical protein
MTHLMNDDEAIELIKPLDELINWRGGKHKPVIGDNELMDTPQVRRDRPLYDERGSDSPAQDRRGAESRNRTCAHYRPKGQAAWNLDLYRSALLQDHDRQAEHAVTFDKHTCRWTILGSAADVHRSNERGKILDALLTATELLGPQQISDRTRMKSDNVRYLLGQMVECGEVLKAARGRYYHPDRSDLSDTPSHTSQPHN